MLTPSKTSSLSVQHISRPHLDPPFPIIILFTYIVMLAYTAIPKDILILYNLLYNLPYTPLYYYSRTEKHEHKSTHCETKHSLSIILILLPVHCLNTLDLINDI